MMGPDSLTLNPLLRILRMSRARISRCRRYWHYCDDAAILQKLHTELGLEYEIKPTGGSKDTETLFYSKAILIF